ncbi:MAG: LCP family protein [Coprobacillus sp.]
MKRFNNKLLRKIVYIIQTLMTLAFLAMTYSIKFIPMKYILIVGVILVALLIGEYFLIFYKKEKSKRSYITQGLSVVLSVLLTVGSFYVYKAGRTVDLLATNSFQKRAISVIVLKDSSIKNETQLHAHTLGYVSKIDESTMKYTTDEIQKELGTMTLKDVADFSTLQKALYNKEIDAIILDEAFRSLLVQEKETFTEDTRVIYQVTKDEIPVNAKNVDVTTKPFLVYISGIDEYGDLSTVSRSDVNMLAAINPTTKQILLISIPRDTYYPLHKNGQLDKFTHTGLYGLDESINTLQDMLSEEINYYVRMNFTSFVDIVDALGGISVYSPYAFKTVKGNYDIVKGYNDLNAKQALSFVRERKRLPAGDFDRGKNQQRMISAIVKKVASPAILTSFSAVLDTIGKSIETNMDTEQMNALVQMQLEKMPNWDIQSYQISGTPKSAMCYSSGTALASVVEPSKESIEKARKYIDQLIANQTVKTDEGDLNQKSEDKK